MSAASALGNLSKSPITPYILLGVVGIVGFIVVKNAVAGVANAAGDAVGKAVGAAGTLGDAVIDTASNLGTGNTQTAHGTPYEGKGILGTLGAYTDALFGGGLSKFGGWLGGNVYDATHPDDKQGAVSNNQANNNAYGGGPSAWYGDAVDNSPVAAQYRISYPDNAPQATVGSPLDPRYTF